MKITKLSMATFTVDSTPKCVQLLILCQHKGMKRSTRYFRNPFVTKGFNSLRDKLKFSIAMATLPFTKLVGLSTSPSVQIAIRINSRCMIVST
jgi:uncharacterized membrane protein